MNPSGARLIAIILALSIVVGAWLLFEMGQQSVRPALPGAAQPEAAQPRQPERSAPGLAVPSRQQPSSTANTSTLYKCRGPAGVSYGSEPCRPNETEIRAVTSSIVQSDPDELAALKAKASQMEASRLAAANARVAASSQAPTVPDNRAECDAIDREIAVIDSQLRQPHSPSLGDYWTGERKKRTDRRFSIGC